MSEPYSPLRYPGGKSKLSNFLVEVIKFNGLVYPHYVEPFAGGAGAALRLLFEEYVDTININDADPGVRCFWQAVTEQNEEFLKKLYEVEVTIEEWNRQREIYTKSNTNNVLELGFATFFLNRTNRSGIIHNGGPIGGYHQNGKYKIDVRYNRSQLARRVQRIGIYSDRIEVCGEDGIELLKKIHSFGKQQKTFVYIDPPYYAKGAELYLNKFTHNHHKKLASYLSRKKNFLWLMTYDNVEEIKTLYRKFPQIQFNLNYSAYERREGQELLIYPSYVNITSESELLLHAVA